MSDQAAQFRAFNLPYHTPEWVASMSEPEAVAWDAMLIGGLEPERALEFILAKREKAQRKRRRSSTYGVAQGERADWILLLSDGFNVHWSGDPPTVYQRPMSAQAAYFVASAAPEAGDSIEIRSYRRVAVEPERRVAFYELEAGR